MQRFQRGISLLVKIITGKKKLNMVKYQTIVHSPALIIKINFAQGFLVFEGVVLTHCSYKSEITKSIVIQKVEQVMAHSFVA